MNCFGIKTQYFVALIGALTLAACAPAGPQRSVDDEIGDGTTAADGYYEGEAQGGVLAGKKELRSKLGGIHPNTDPNGPVPDPWKPMGPVPDPWNGGGSSGANPPPNPNPNPNPSPNPDPDKDD